MNSPSITTALVAIVLAVIAYLVAGFVENISTTIVALIAFVSAFIAPLFNKQQNSQDDVAADISTIYVGNLPYRANEAAVRELFSEYGNVHSVRLMKDKNTGKRRGFGFVEMPNKAAQQAISKLNDSEFQQRTLKVREAKERPEKPAEVAVSE